MSLDWSPVSVRSQWKATLNTGCNLTSQFHDAQLNLPGHFGAGTFLKHLSDKELSLPKLGGTKGSPLACETIPNHTSSTRVESPILLTSRTKSSDREAESKLY